MAVIEAFDNLAEEVARYIFFELAAFSDISEQIPTPTYLHHKNDMLRCFKRLVQSHNVVMASQPQYIELLHYFPFGGFFSHVLFVD